MTKCRECGCDSDQRDYCKKVYKHPDIVFNDPRNNGNPMCAWCCHVFTKGIEELK